MPERCEPCLGPDIKAAIREKIGGAAIEAMLDRIPSCDNPQEVTVCGGRGRARTPRTQFMSQCLKGKHIKSFAEAPQAMRECSKEWREGRT